MRLLVTILAVLMVIGLSPVTTLAPMASQPHKVTSQVSRGEPVATVERRIMRITAYTAHDKGMNGRGVTASGELAREGTTIAADISIPFGSQIYIPKYGNTYTVTDRGGVIQGDRLDLYMESREDALEFGVQYLEVWIK